MRDCRGIRCDCCCMAYRGKLDDPVIAKALLTQWVTLQVIVTPIFIAGRLFIARFRAKRANS